MLTIRLSRFGKKKHPIYRVVISEHQKDTVGNYLELLGQYNPHTNTSELNEERIKYWISKGAQTSGTVHNLLVDKKIISAEKIKVANIKKKKGDNKEETKPAEKKTESDKNTKEDKKEDKLIDPARPASGGGSANSGSRETISGKEAPKEGDTDKK